MVGDKEVLLEIFKGSEMGMSSLDVLINELEKTDNKIKSNVYKAKKQYETFYKKSKKLLKSYKINPERPSVMSKTMSKIGSKMEFMRDNSDSKIAETLVQGYEMGLISIRKKTDSFKKEISKDIFKLATDYEKMMENGLSDIKGFL